MKKKHTALKITLISVLGCIVAIPLLIAIFFFIAFGGLNLFSSAPKPQIKSAAFDFTLEYKIDGEIKTVSDTQVCEFDGYNINEGSGKTLKWTSYYTSDPEMNKLIIHHIDDNLIVVLSPGCAHILMSDPTTPWYHPKESPTISIFDQSAGYYLDEVESDKILAEHGFEILHWECDPPIENKYVNSFLTF